VKPPRETILGLLDVTNVLPGVMDNSSESDEDWNRDLLGVAHQSRALLLVEFDSIFYELFGL
jgi:hypothetical protein